MAKDRISELTLKEMNMINDIFSGKSKIKIIPKSKKQKGGSKK